ncbi:hypothetical protein DWY73_05155 [Bacteroides fragilis]|uniref:Uncharacterized protein n=1 Tax=Bacteroides fragilis TaxID=817 RepID=A0A3E5IAT7_BACFG|nr:hypothetical protein F2Z40_15135 [Bacteroides fragilis]KAA5087108.1 hypothetical protein F2Z82_15360 [Bacteroides fragilis]KAA5090435.1 hypothetical protein F2Z45_13135 [Bacteroides fragilis]KAA5101033.1 hypothetical protein F2Z46_11420 [Bacteroides fragilis]KAA5103530.1 hypothetical protein F2Z51_14600 [Bacteroides fragilis]
MAPKERNETLFRLELLFKTEYLSETEYSSMFVDANELMKLMITSIKTVKYGKA